MELNIFDKIKDFGKCAILGYIYTWKEIKNEWNKYVHNKKARKKGIELIW